jgi:hypothetical protein
MRTSVVFTWKQLIETQFFEFSVKYWSMKHVSRLLSRPSFKAEVIDSRNVDIAEFYNCITKPVRRCFLSPEKSVLFTCQNIEKCCWIPTPITAKINLLLPILSEYFGSL